MPEVLSEGRQIIDLPPLGSLIPEAKISVNVGGFDYQVTASQLLALFTESAPEALDTWLEVVAQIQDNEDAVAALMAAIALKADASTTNINGLTAKTTPADADVMRIADSAASFGFKKLSFANLKAWVLSFVGRGLVQEASSFTGSVLTGTLTVPDDDTIPQIGEGNEFLTLAFTPTSALNILEVDVQLFLSVNLESARTVALFRNGVADALKASRPATLASGIIDAVNIKHRMVAGTTSPITFSVRAGANSASTTTLNGTGGARRLGGALNSYIQVKEYLPLS